jgi:hypothetical protein
MHRIFRLASIPHTTRQAPGGWPTLQEFSEAKRAIDLALVCLDILEADAFRCEKGAVVIRHAYGVGAL